LHHCNPQDSEGDDMSYIKIIDSYIAGIPCKIGVEDYTSEAGSGHWDAPSDVDFYGYTESCWEVLDRRGRPASWLAKKLTSSDEDRIEVEIAEAFDD
jgi:hypothetical protein